VQPQSKRDAGHLVVDEAAFEQLLSAAYVMQEHNSRLKKAPRPVTQSTAPIATEVPIVPPTPSAQPVPFPAPPLTEITGKTCTECGATVASNEFFCENCGAPAERTGNTTQKNWASLWEIHRASTSETGKENENQEDAFTSTGTLHAESEVNAEEIDLFPAELEEIVGKFPETDVEQEPESSPTPTDGALTWVSIPSQAENSTDHIAVQHSSTWTSAAKARVWLDSLKAQQPSKDWFREEWTIHRGAIYIAMAAAVLLAVVFQSSTPSATPDQPRQLSVFEQVLVSLGVAEAPPASTLASYGNPQTKVWVDVHTALYYCPGAELYGKTPDGRYATQLDAQRDHFQPSTLKACD
jgi:hypothetical protein